jgi:hypothetical protein
VYRQNLPGWLLYAGPGPKEATIVTGDVFQFSIEGRYSRWGGGEVEARFILPAPVFTQGRTLAAMLWDALLTWPRPGLGREWPPELHAMAGLARKHPHEYQALLCEGRQKAGVAPLEVIPDGWLNTP